MNTLQRATSIQHHASPRPCHSSHPFRTGHTMREGGATYSPPQVSWDPQVEQYMQAALGVQAFAAMQAALAAPPLHTCVRVNTLRTTPQEVAEQLRGLLPAADCHTDQPAAGEAAGSNGTAVGAGSSRFRITCHPQVPAVILQGSGPQPVDLSAVSKQVLISRKAGEAVLRGAQVFTPGVLGCSSGVCAGDTVAVMIDMGKQGSAVTRGIVLPALSPPDSSSSSSTGQQHWLCAGIGRACVGRVEMFRLQHGVAVELTQRVYDVPSLNGQLRGLVMLQNLPSIVAASVLHPPPGSRVLDMCAAPGGKTTMLAQIMQGRGQVFALDRSHAKVDDIRSLAEELGCSSCITAIKMDATKAVAASNTAAVPAGEQLQKASAAGAAGNGSCGLPAQEQPQQPSPQQPLQQHIEEQQSQPPPQQQQAELAIPQGMSAKAQQRLSRRLAAMAARGHTPQPVEFRRCGPDPAVPKFAGFAPESFTHVLLDAPCTALGLRPKLQQPLTLKELLETAAYQRQLLAAAVRLVQPGGFLVYSTCSVSPAENEANVRHALDTYPCLRLVPAEPRVGGPGLTGPADATGLAAVLGEEVTAPCWLSEEEAGLVQRFYPGGGGQQQQDTIGFFAARFQKVASC